MSVPHYRVYFRKGLDGTVFALPFKYKEGDKYPKEPEQIEVYIERSTKTILITPKQFLNLYWPLYV